MKGVHMPALDILDNIVPISDFNSGLRQSRTQQAGYRHEAKYAFFCDYDT